MCVLYYAVMHCYIFNIFFIFAAFWCLMLFGCLCVVWSGAGGWWVGSPAG